MLLAGDIGGTKTSLAVFSHESGPRFPLEEKTFTSADFPSLKKLVGEFLSSTDLVIEQASFGVAGPVIENRVKITNLDWRIDSEEMKESFNLSQVHLLNDLLAMAAAVPILNKDDLSTLIPGEPEPGGAIALIAPGTGLGEAYLTWDGARYLPFGSEGGHSDFAPSSKLEIKLLQFLRVQFGHVSCERVCSGSGIPNIYNFLKAGNYAKEPGWLAKKIALANDPTPVIIKTAQDKKKNCKLCRMTLNTFINILGAEAGNLALKVLSTGGVYLGGGIPPRLLADLNTRNFRKSFLGKGRMKEVLRNIPVHVITNPNVALIGAAHYGFNHWKT
ncbi:MAG: glucokinase [Anaerolineales bacterium]